MFGDHFSFGLYRRQTHRATLALALLYVSFGGLLLRSPDNALECLILLLLLLPTLALAPTNSRFLLPYILLIWIIAPEIRRVVDWAQGEYTPNSLISLAPQLASLTLLLPVWMRPLTIAPELKKALGFLGFAFFYAAGIGLLRNGLSAAYDILNYFTPFLVIFYVLAGRVTISDRDRWIRALVTFTALTAIYGWIQLLLLPPWDKFWIESTRMGAVGLPQPLKFRIFSALNSPGPYAMLLAAAFVATLFDRRWRGILGWFGMGMIGSALIITMVRTAWLYVIFALLLMLLFAPRAWRWKLMLAALAVSLFVTLAVPRLPVAEAVRRRVDTELMLQKHSSLNIRAVTSVQFLRRILKTPFGSGLGGISVANQKFDSSANEIVTDTGYLQLLFMFGPFGSLALGLGLWFLYQAMRQAGRSSPEMERFSILGRVTLIVFLLCLASSNGFPGISGLLLWLFIAFSLGRHQSDPLIAAPPTSASDRGRPVAASPALTAAQPAQEVRSLR